MTTDTFTDVRPRPRIALPLRTRLLDRFEIGRVLGRPGGFGITYLALDVRLNRVVAVKEYFPRNLASRDGGMATGIVPQTQDDLNEFVFGKERFLAEARTLALFDHPGIVGVRDFFEANGTAYLVMPYYDGMTLEAFAQGQAEGRLDEEGAVRIAILVLDALSAVHEAGMLHRDIKPENIYLRHPTGRPTLLDFGAAQAEAAQRSRTIERALTPGYAAVEQYITQGEQGPWTDLYGVGASLYRLLTGQVPTEALSRIGSTDPLRPVDEVVPTVRSEVSAAVMWALQPQATDRPTSAALLRDTLGGAIAAPAGSAGAPARLPERPADPRSPEVEPAAIGSGAHDPRATAIETAEHGADRASSAAGDRPPRRTGLGVTVAVVAFLSLAGMVFIGTRAKIGGWVRDSNGRGVAGAVVFLRSPDGLMRTARTDRVGRFDFSFLPKDRRYSVGGTHSRYLIFHDQAGARSDVGAFLSQWEENLRRSVDLRLVARSPEESWARLEKDVVTAVLEAASSEGGRAVKGGLPHLDEVIRLFPDSSRARQARLVGRWYTGDYDGCLEDAQRLEEGVLESTRAWCRLGAGDFNSAVSSFTRLAGNSNSADAHVGLAVANHRLGKPAASQANFRAAVQRFAAFGRGRSAVQGQGSYYYNPAEWAAIDSIHSLYRARVRGVEILFENRCTRAVRVAFNFRTASGWRSGWWNFPATSGRRRLTVTGGGPALTVTDTIYYYAETTDQGRGLVWRGDHSRTVDGRRYPMHRRISSDPSRASLSITCS